MSDHCYVYPLRSPPDHISILSSTYQENLRDFIQGKFQTLITSDQLASEIFRTTRNTQDLLVALHTHWNIGSLPGGLNANQARLGKELQLERLRAFQYIYNLATLNDKPSSQIPSLSQSIRNANQINSVYYLDAIPRSFIRCNHPDTVVINRETFNYCEDIIAQYPYLQDTTIPTIASNWTNAARDAYLNTHGTNHQPPGGNSLSTQLRIPMLVTRSYDTDNCIGGVILYNMLAFTNTWNEVRGNMLAKLQHHYTQKVFGVDTRTDPVPLKPHVESQMEAVRFRYFEYLTEFQSDRTPERLNSKRLESQGESEEGDEEEASIPELNQIPGDMYYRMEYLTVNTTDSWFVVYNQLDEYDFSDTWLEEHQADIRASTQQDSNFTRLTPTFSQMDLSIDQQINRLTNLFTEIGDTGFSGPWNGSVRNQPFTQRHWNQHQEYFISLDLAPGYEVGGYQQYLLDRKYLLVLYQVQASSQRGASPGHIVNVIHNIRRANAILSTSYLDGVFESLIAMVLPSFLPALSSSTQALHIPSFTMWGLSINHQIGRLTDLFRGMGQLAQYMRRRAPSHIEDANLSFNFQGFADRMLPLEFFEELSDMDDIEDFIPQDIMRLVPTPPGYVWYGPWVYQQYTLDREYLALLSQIQANVRRGTEPPSIVNVIQNIRQGSTILSASHLDGVFESLIAMVLEGRASYEERLAEASEGNPDDESEQANLGEFHTPLSPASATVVAEIPDDDINATLDPDTSNLSPDSEQPVGRPNLISPEDGSDYSGLATFETSLENVLPTPQYAPVSPEFQSTTPIETSEQGEASESQSGGTASHRAELFSRFLHPDSTNSQTTTAPDDLLEDTHSHIGKFNGLTSPIYDVLELPEGTKLQYISYWARHDVVLCYCRSSDSVAIRDRRDIPGSDGELDMPYTLRHNTPRSFYVYLPRSKVSCSVLDVDLQSMTILSLSDPTWGTSQFYSKYVIRPWIPHFGKFQGSINPEMRDLIMPNGSCNNVGWSRENIMRAIQFSGITLNQDTFPLTQRSLVAYKDQILSNRNSVTRIDPQLWSRSPKNIVRLISAGEYFLHQKLRREFKKYNVGVRFERACPRPTRVWPDIFSVSGFPVDPPTPSVQLATPEGRLVPTVELSEHRHFVIPYDHLSNSGYTLTTPTRDQITDVRQRGYASRFFPWIYRGFPHVNLTLTMVADCLHRRSEMATRIQTRVRRQLPATQPQDEWQRLCGQIRNSEVDDNRLREIIVQRSQINADPNRHLTMEGLAGLSKRRLCLLVVMQEMRDDRVKVRGIRKLMERHRARQAQLEERYPEPSGICTNIDAPMDVVGDQVSDNLNQLCLIRGKCRSIRQFFQRYSDTTYRDFEAQVQLILRRNTLLYRQQYAQQSEDYQAEIDQITAQLGEFMEQFSTFSSDVDTVFNREIYGNGSRSRVIVTPLTLMRNSVDSSEQSTNRFSLYAYDHVMRDGDPSQHRVQRMRAQLPTPSPPPDLELGEIPEDEPTRSEIYQSDIETSRVNWDRDQGLTFREWAEHYRSLNWDDLFNKPIEMFVRNKLSDTIRDYTKHLNETNPNYRGEDTNLSMDDIKEMCDNFTRDAPTYQNSEPGDYFVLVRSDFQSRCIHRSVLDVAELRDRYLCEWVAPPSHPDALTDPNFDTGMYYNTTNDTIAVLSPRFPERKFYPIPLSETTQGVDTAYFDQTDFSQIRRLVEANLGSVQVFYLGDGTSVRMGNCAGNFRASQTHGQRDVAFQYRIRYHREITPERLEFLSEPTGEDGVVGGEQLAELQERLTLLETRIRAAAMSRDRQLVRQLSRDKRYLKRHLEWLTMGVDQQDESRQRFCRQIRDETNNIHQQIDHLEQERDEATRAQLHQTVTDEWAQLLHSADCTSE